MLGVFNYVTRLVKQVVQNPPAFSFIHPIDADRELRIHEENLSSSHRMYPDYGMGRG